MWSPGDKDADMLLGSFHGEQVKGRDVFYEDLVSPSLQDKIKKRKKKMRGKKTTSTYSSGLATGKGKLANESTRGSADDKPRADMLKDRARDETGSSIHKRKSIVVSTPGSA